MTDKPIDIYRHLVEMQGSLYDTPRNNERRLKNIHTNGEEIPDYLLPGRVIMELTSEQREILSKLTSYEVSMERQLYT